MDPQASPGAPIFFTCFYRGAGARLEFKITVVNWDKYQGRKDIERPHWFRFENGLWRDEQFYRFASQEKWVWVCMLSYCSERGSGTVSFDVDWFCSQAGVSEEILKSSIDKLVLRGCITADSPGKKPLRRRNAGVTPTNGDVTLQNRTEHYRTEQNIYAHSAPHHERGELLPFEAPEKPLVGGGGSQIADALRKAYALYPRKQGKTPGLTRLKPQIKTLEDAEAFTQAVKNFRRQMEHEGREVDKILYFSTFCSKTNWVDWINPDGKLFRDEVTSLHTNEEIGDLG